MSIINVIKYEGDNNTFVWKHPCEDFNILSQLIVHESQEAVFVRNGHALDVLGPGRHTLKTANIPFLRNIIGLATDDETPFHCEVYFINKTVQMGIKWGTDNKVRFIDPNFGVPLEIGASGELNLMVSDSKKLLVKLVGTTNGIAWEECGDKFTKSLSASFRPLISTAVKTNIASCIKDNNINILEIDENLELLSKVLRTSIIPGFEEYGLTVPEFFVNTVVLPEGDANFKNIRELHSISLQKKMVEADAEIKTAMAQSEASVAAAQREAVLEQETILTEKTRSEAEREVIRAQAAAQKARLTGLAEAEIMQAKGYTEKDVLQAEVQKAYAEGIGNMNISGDGGSSIAGDLLGLGVGMAAAGVVSGQVGEIFKNINTPSTNEPQPSPTVKITCPECNSEVPEGSKFCLECGKRIEILAENEVICPACGKKTNKGNFCIECGASLVTKCAKCGAELPTGAKFCLECGEKI